MVFVSAWWPMRSSSMNDTSDPPQYSISQGRYAVIRRSTYLSSWFLIKFKPVSMLARWDVLDIKYKDCQWQCASPRHQKWWCWWYSLALSSGRCGHTEVFVIFLFCVGFDVTTPNLPMQNLSTKKFNTKYVCLSGEFSSDSTYVA